MKILIAYDGSGGSKNALHDVAFAGLPAEDVEVRLVTVAEFIFPADSMFFVDASMPLVTFTSDRVRDMSTYALESAESMAKEGKELLQKLCPKWKIESWARLSSPASTILEVARDWNPDLLIMGSHGRSALGRFFIGSVSLRVAAEARCSIRVVKREPRKRPPTILLGYDGSTGSRSAVGSLVHRSWPKDTSLQIVTVADTSLLDYLSLIGTELQDGEKEKEARLELMVVGIEDEMKKYFSKVNSMVCMGSASHEIVKEAERIDADMIFLGSHSYATLDKSSLGSVAHGVMAHAKATVEIVR